MVTEFNPNVTVKFLNINGIEYILPDDCYYTIKLLSCEDICFPEGTIRYIGGIPWEVVRSDYYKSAFFNLLTKRKFKPTYLVCWHQALVSTMTSRDFFQKIYDSLLKNL